MIEPEQTMKKTGHFSNNLKRIKEEAASKNVADILFQMIADEKRYGLDDKTAKLLQDGPQ